MDADNICSSAGAMHSDCERPNSAEMPKGDKFNPHRVGVDHIALACSDASELKRVAAALSAAGIENTGAKRDETLGKDYVVLRIRTASPGNLHGVIVSITRTRLETSMRVRLHFRRASLLLLFSARFRPCPWRSERPDGIICGALGAPPSLRHCSGQREAHRLGSI